jgi:hypothetical protein
MKLRKSKVSPPPANTTATLKENKTFLDTKIKKHSLQIDYLSRFVRTCVAEILNYRSALFSINIELTQ